MNPTCSPYENVLSFTWCSNEAKFSVCINEIYVEGLRSESTSVATTFDFGSVHDVTEKEPTENVCAKDDENMS